MGVGARLGLRERGSPGISIPNSLRIRLGVPTLIRNGSGQGGSDAGGNASQTNLLLLCGAGEGIGAAARVVRTAVGAAGKLAGARPFDTFHPVPPLIWYLLVAD